MVESENLKPPPTRFLIRIHIRFWRYEESSLSLILAFVFDFEDVLDGFVRATDFSEENTTALFRVCSLSVCSDSLQKLL